MSINPFLNSIVHPYAHVVNITHSMEGNFDFMKSGQDSVIPEENISNEDIASVAAPFVVYMQKALEVCDVYVLHCGRSVIRPEDIARCLAYTARDFQNMLRLVRQRYGHHSSMGNAILVLVVPQIAIHGRTSCNAIQESWSFCCNL